MTTTILSLTAASRLAGTIVRRHAEPVPVANVIADLERHGVDTERAAAGVRLAVTVGRIEAVELEGELCLQLPDLEAAA